MNIKELFTRPFHLFPLHWLGQTWIAFQPKGCPIAGVELTLKYLDIVNQMAAKFGYQVPAHSQGGKNLIGQPGYIGVIGLGAKTG